MIWLIGNKGMLGTELLGLFTARGLLVIGTDREVDILDRKALEGFASGKNINWIVNCAAYTAVDKAEENVELCRKLNADGPENIARTAKKLGAEMIHVSTDYVFDGSASRPYTEEDPVKPLGMYGITKAEGETSVRANIAEAFIIRTAWLYGRYGNNFVYTMLRLMRKQEKIGVVADQYGSPTYAGDLATAIATIIDTGYAEYGTYHFTDEGTTTWHEFASEIYRLGREYGLLDHDCTIEALTTAQYPTKTRRPAYSVLSKEKIKKVPGIVVPAWKESLAKFMPYVTQEEFKSRIL
jgi:dTDP-4-dehydrorhamnose reductase